MKLNVLALVLIVVAAANAQCPHLMESMQGSRKYRMKTTTSSETVITPEDGDTESSYKRVSPTSMSDSTFQSQFSENDRMLIRSMLRMAKNNGNIAPKIFIRYFRAKPSSQQYFPAFANVPLNELPRNGAFLSNAYTCFAAFHYYSHYSGTSDPKTCPYLMKVYHKYKPEDIKELNSIIVSVMEEELGNRFTSEAKSAFERGLDVMMTAITKEMKR